MSERDAIVAWLRAEARKEKPFGLVDTYAAKWALNHAADAIERGEHMPDAHAPVDEVARLREAIPLKFDPRLAKQWWLDRNTSSFVSAKLAGDGYVKFQWRDVDETGGYSVPWLVVALDLARKALDTRP